MSVAVNGSDRLSVEFQKHHPNITLEWETLSQKQYREALPLMFQSGDAPDIFFWLSQANRELTAAELYDLGWAAPLTDEMPEEFLSRWPQGSFLPGINIIDGKYYSFPFNDNKIRGAGYMYMSGDVFEAAGLDTSTPQYPVYALSIPDAAENVLMSIGYTPECMQAVAAYVFGEGPAEGLMPVSNSDA